MIIVALDPGCCMTIYFRFHFSNEAETVKLSNFKAKQFNFHSNGYSIEFLTDSELHRFCRVRRIFKRQGLEFFLHTS